MNYTRATFSAKPADFPADKKKWFLIDLDGKPLGRVAVVIADLLRGKNLPTFTPHVDTGAFVVAINASKIALTGAKLDRKIYHRHTGYVGHLRSASAREIMAKKPEQILRMAVKGMLPKNRLSNQLIKKLKIYPDSAHPHAAQNPKPIDPLKKHSTRGSAE